MKILICGLGSVGRRHLRHFLSLGVDKVTALRSGKATLTDDSHIIPHAVFRSWEEALADHPDAVVVCNPTSLHLETARRAVEAGCHVLVEKPVSHCLDGLTDLCEASTRRGVVVSVAQNMRYHPILNMVREHVFHTSPLGRVVMLRAHFGSYLPSWHPWENYKGSYAARRNLGGGCRLTHIHEIDTAMWILGPVEHATGLDGGTTPLGTDVDETAGILLRHKSGALSIISLSLAQTPSSRSLNLAFEGGVIDVNLLTGDWVITRREGETEKGGTPPGFTIDDTYKEQDRDFLRAVRGEIPPAVPLKEAMRVLEVALSGEEAYRGRSIT